LSKNEDLLYAGADGTPVLPAESAPAPAAPPSSAGRSFSSYVLRTALPRSKSKSALGTDGGAAERGKGFWRIGAAPAIFPRPIRAGCRGGAPAVVAEAVADGAFAETFNLPSTALESSSMAEAEDLAGAVGGAVGTVPAWGLDWSGRTPSPPLAWTALGCCSVAAGRAGAASATDDLGPVGAGRAGNCGGGCGNCWGAAFGIASSIMGWGRCCCDGGLCTC
jgi:hypothetical protein